MTKILARLILASALVLSCVQKPLIRTETDVLSSLDKGRITTFSALGKASYYGSQGYLEADFRCSAKGELFRFTITGPLGIMLGDIVSFGDSLYLYDALNGVLMISKPDRSLKELTGVEMVPAELKNALVGNLPNFENLKDFRQENGKIILEFPTGRYYYKSKNLALLRIEQPNATVDFSDFISTATGPRPTFIQIIQGKERIEITIRQQAVNPPLADEIFQFHIPEGTEILDLR